MPALVDLLARRALAPAGNISSTAWAFWRLDGGDEILNVILVAHRDRRRIEEAPLK